MLICNLSYWVEKFRILLQSFQICNELLGSDLHLAQLVDSFLDELHVVSIVLQTNSPLVGLGHVLEVGLSAGNGTGPNGVVSISGSGGNGLSHLQVELADDNSHQEIKSFLLVLAVLSNRESLCAQHTQWFHADCLADYYQVPVFGEDHWRIIGNFMESAVRHGINTILTPIFTPPLDTARGGERTTVQLVKISLNDGTYRFDFSLLKRWIDLCASRGIEYLEMAHLFTQWGAVCAPKILVSIDGAEETKLFGWHTAATSPEYTAFLRCFLPALKAFLQAQGWLEKTFFHISDEPNLQQATSYAEARMAVKDLLADCRVMDALSDYSIYQTGVVERPVVSADHIQPFLDANVPHLWAYYCTAQAIHVPNRFIAMPSTRNRILGTLLYYYHIEGFLHWGFNFYNSQHSVRHIDPYLTTDAEEAFPSGDPFLVYPAPDGTAYDSVRGMVLRQALSDLRMLCYLEEKLGRSAVTELIDSLTPAQLTFSQYPREKAFFEKLKDAAFEKSDSISLCG